MVEVKVNTESLRQLQQRLYRVNGRLESLDSRLDQLYLRSGLLDIWFLAQADFQISWNGKINAAANYLGDTANDLDATENKIINESQNPAIVNGDAGYNPFSKTIVDDIINRIGLDISAIGSLLPIINQLIQEGVSTDEIEKFLKTATEDAIKVLIDAGKEGFAQAAFLRITELGDKINDYSIADLEALSEKWKNIGKIGQAALGAFEFALGFGQDLAEGDSIGEAIAFNAAGLIKSASNFCTSKGVGAVIGKVASGVGFIAGVVEDLHDGKGVGQALVKNGISAGIGIATTAIATLVIGATPVGWAAVGTAAIGTAISIGFDHIYENNLGGTKDFVDGIGNGIDQMINTSTKALENSMSSVKKSVGQSIQNTWNSINEFAFG